MKKLWLAGIVILFAIAIQIGCNSGEQKSDIAKLPVAAPQDSLKIFLQVKKMEIKAYSMLQPGYYDSSLARYDQCISFLNKALIDNKNKGLYLFAGEFIQINQSKEAIYDSIHQPENSVKCALECLKWSKLTHDNMMEVKLDIHISDKYKNAAVNVTDDTAKKGTFLRQALLYSFAGVRVIDSLRTSDMDDSKYECFHLSSKIYALLGYRVQAKTYDKKYRDLYFKIFNQQPNK